MSALDWKPEAAVLVPDEDLGPGTDWRGIPRGLSQLTWKMDFSEAIGVGPCGPCHDSRETPSFLPQHEENRRFSPQQVSPFSSDCLERNPIFPLESQKSF